jgi:hypothetical protein
MIGYAVVSGRSPKTPLIFAALWLAFYAGGRVLPGGYAVAVVAHALLMVVLALWLKVTDTI